MDVCFIERGLGSMVATSSDSETVEVGHIGREGMSGEHIVMGTDMTPNRTFMQVAGAGYLMPASALMDILNSDLETRLLFLRYVHCCALQLSHTALSNGRYNVYERLARWLLMVHDRIDGDDLPLTHEFLGIMLGVRRSGVTDQIHLLEGIHAIKPTRVIFDVVTRDALLIHEGQIHPLEGPFQSKAEAQEAADLVAARLEDNGADNHFAARNID
jgi:CRP-like cAMP-binding protein